MTWGRQMPGNWRTLKRKVAARAGNRCEATEHGQRCPAQGTECHHINGADNHDLDSLAWLCAPHHDRITKAQAAAGRAAQPSMRRAPEPHPGAWG